MSKRSRFFVFSALLFIFTVWLYAPGSMMCASAQGATIQLDTMSNLQVVKSVPNQNSAAFKRNVRNDLRMQTTRWDKVPYSMYVGSYSLILRSPKKVVLAGNAQGNAAWSIDNFLLVEIFNQQGILQKRAVVGGHEPVLANNAELPKIGQNKHSFAPGEIDITSLLPVNTVFNLKVSAMDYGGVGYVSDVFLIVQHTAPPPPPPPAAPVNLTGVWNCNDGGRYYVRQLGNIVWWFGEHSSTSPAWSNVARGTINGKELHLDWADVPKGRVMNSGILLLDILIPGKMTAKQKTGGFGGSVWTK